MEQKAPPRRIIKLNRGKPKSPVCQKDLPIPCEKGIIPEAPALPGGKSANIIQSRDNVKEVQTVNNTEKPVEVGQIETIVKGDIGNVSREEDLVAVDGEEVNDLFKHFLARKIEIIELERSIRENDSAIAQKMNQEKEIAMRRKLEEKHSNKTATANIEDNDVDKEAEEKQSKKHKKHKKVKKSKKKKDKDKDKIRIHDEKKEKRDTRYDSESEKDKSEENIDDEMIRVQQEAYNLHPKDGTKRHDHKRSSQVHSRVGESSRKASDRDRDQKLVDSLHKHGRHANQPENVDQANRAPKSPNERSRRSTAPVKKDNHSHHNRSEDDIDMSRRRHSDSQDTERKSSQNERRGRKDNDRTSSSQSNTTRSSDKSHDGDKCVERQSGRVMDIKEDLGNIPSWDDRQKMKELVNAPSWDQRQKMKDKISVKKKVKDEKKTEDEIEEEYNMRLMEEIKDAYEKKGIKRPLPTKLDISTSSKKLKATEEVVVSEDRLQKAQRQASDVIQCDRGDKTNNDNSSMDTEVMSTDDTGLKVEERVEMPDKEFPNIQGYSRDIDGDDRPFRVMKFKKKEDEDEEDVDFTARTLKKKDDSANKATSTITGPDTCSLDGETADHKTLSVDDRNNVSKQNTDSVEDSKLEGDKVQKKPAIAVKLGLRISDTSAALISSGVKVENDIKKKNREEGETLII